MSQISFSHFIGWKLPDLSLATKRSLSDASVAIARQLEQVYSSISASSYPISLIAFLFPEAQFQRLRLDAICNFMLPGRGIGFQCLLCGCVYLATKRNLSSKLDHVEGGLDYIAEQKDAIGQEVGTVTQLHDDVGFFHANIESVRHVVQTLETQVHRIEENEEGMINSGYQMQRRPCNDSLGRFQGERMFALVKNGWVLGEEILKTVSKQVGCLQQTGSLPPVLFLEPPSSSSSNGLNEVQQSMKTAVSAAGLTVIFSIPPSLY
ncbi:hypothetical protein Nepgr_004106 [Nepenthes gracilis]|uniref:Uncharacterized protein n=1 Tax=Nepenthes gracilis TaxID=150966 RepID=A0AAD3S0R5_NEPGR|nr:hypothetical protein Nepgr_004106 [Nepenthes gracilis]